MSIFSSNLSNKMYWPVVGCYFLLIVLFVIMYYSQINDWSNRAYYNMMYFKRIFLPLTIVLASLFAKYQENLKLANMILYIPLSLVVGFFILSFLVMFIISYFLTSK